MFSSTDFAGGAFIESLAVKNYDKYWAHIRNEEHETLYEHTRLVAQYGDVLINTHQLSNVIEVLFRDFICKHYRKDCEKEAILLVRNMFYSTIGYHDAGKINPNFQYTKMQNELFSKINSSLGSEHSKTGAYSFIQKLIPACNSALFSGDEKILNVFLLLAFSTVILKHHAPFIQYSNEFAFSDEFIEDALVLLDELDLSFFPVEQQKALIKNLNKKFLIKVRDYLKSENSFTIFALLKLNFSLLTASDYWATTHYMDGWSAMPTDFGLLNKELKKKIVDNAENKEPYNQRAYQKLKNHTVEFPLERSNDNLNKLRQNLSIELIKGIRENIDRHLFYIEAPTGGGKTNLSMLAMAEFLRHDLQTGHDSVSKVFYVFPFTTLITQTYKSLKDNLGLTNNEIVQLHSKSGFSTKNTEQFGIQKENIIDYQFLNYPVSLISHIRFFDILKSNKKSVNYILHRLANSLVIIDELQTYTPKQWDKVIYFINNYALSFNIRFILMSATLPKIEVLLSKESDDEKDRYEGFVYLNQFKHEYFSNPNFKNRVQIDYSLLEEINFKSIPEKEQLACLWLKVIQFSREYLDVGNNRVHTIVEFIFKKTASKFIEIAIQENSLFDEVFILSGTILEPRRREIIEKLKSTEYGTKNILLISTQVVEAGVDIDMDLGFKDTSILDSDEQLAGRINRNAKKSMCKLYLFDLDDANVIYGKDERYKIQQTELKTEWKDIIEKKDFDRLYNRVMQYRNKVNNQQGGMVNLNSYINAMLKLDFDTVDKEFKLIDNAFSNETMFIPFDIPVTIPLSTDCNFEDDELDFLVQKGKFNHGDQFVSGEKIWNLYEEIICNQHPNFSSQAKAKIIMQGLLSKYSIAVSLYSTEFKNAVLLGAVEERYGFYYLHHVDDVYSYTQGFKSCEVDSAIIF